MSKNNEDTATLGASGGIFVYGTLMAEEMLSFLLTGSSENYKTILSLRQPAVLYNYRRVPVKHGDYPALVPGGPSDKVDGYLIIPRSAREWKKIDDFEGEIYRRKQVDVYLTQSNNNDNQPVPAEVYVWVEDMDRVWQDREWSFSYFKEKRLPDWLDLFDGMKMVG